MEEKTMNLDEYTQSEKTYTYKKPTFDKVKEPWSAMYFETKPSKLELGTMEDNRTFRRDNVIRIISYPLPFKSIYWGGEHICSSWMDEFHTVVDDGKGNSKPVNRDMWAYTYEQRMKEKNKMYKEVDENNDVLPLPVLNSFSAF